MTFYDINGKDKLEGKHELWDIEKVIQFSSLMYRLKDLETNVGRNGYGIDCGLRCLYLQFHYDLSDRELEKRLRFDIAFRWFCGLSFEEESPDHSYFGRFRKAVGTNRLGKIFKTLVKRADDKGLIRHMFRFADATSIISKNTTWDERDRAIKAGEDALNNQNISKYNRDTQARFGCKGKSKFWFGYKGHITADMSSGLIEYAAVTEANVSDQSGFKHVCPRKQEMVFADKAYCLKPAQLAMIKRGAHSAAILKKNMKGKNKDLDRYRSQLRAPFEGIFSKFEKRTRYRGLAKTQFQFFMDSLVHNVKRLVLIHPPPLLAGA